jgi:hypothetical protein
MRETCSAYVLWVPMGYEDTEPGINESMKKKNSYHLLLQLVNHFSRHFVAVGTVGVDREVKKLFISFITLLKHNNIFNK